MMNVEKATMNPGYVPFKIKDGTLAAVTEYVASLRAKRGGDLDKTVGNLLTLDLDKGGQGLITAAEHGFPNTKQTVRYPLGAVGAVGQVPYLAKIGVNAYVAMGHEGVIKGRYVGDQCYADIPTKIGPAIFAALLNNGEGVESDIRFGANVSRPMAVYAGMGLDQWRAVRVANRTVNAVTIDFAAKMAILAVNHKGSAHLYVSGISLEDLWIDQVRAARFVFDGKEVVGFSRVAEDGTFWAVLREHATGNFMAQKLNRNAAGPANTKAIGAAGKIINTGKRMFVDVPNGDDGLLAFVDFTDTVAIEVGPKAALLGGAFANA